MNRVGEQQPCKSTAKKEKRNKASIPVFIYILYITHAPIQVTFAHPVSSCHFQKALQQNRNILTILFINNPKEIN